MLGRGCLVIISLIHNAQSQKWKRYFRKRLSALVTTLLVSVVTLSLVLKYCSSVLCVAFTRLFVFVTSWVTMNFLSMIKQADAMIM